MSAIRAAGLRFAVLAVCSAGAVALYVVWSVLQLGGSSATVAFEDVSEAVAALLAAAACALAARRSGGRTRAGWSLLATSAASWAAGQVAWTIYEVGLADAVPFPSGADVGFVLAVPFAIAGVLTFPSGPSTLTNRFRVLLDGAIVAASLVFVAWPIGLHELVDQPGFAVTSRVLVVGYPAADVMVITLLALSVRKAAGRFRQVVMLLIAGFSLNLLADGSFAYLVLHGDYGVLGSVFDAGWLGGYLLVGLAACWPAQSEQAATDDGPVEAWQLVMPWVGIVAVIGTAAWLVLAGVQYPVLSGLGSAIGVLFLLSQALTLRDSLRWLTSSRRAEAQLRERTTLLGEIIGRAPLGIARVGDDFRILDANPRLCEMLATPSRALVGSSLARFLSEEEIGRARERMELMRAGRMIHVEIDSDMLSADGRRLWIHRTVTPVTRADGRIDYYLVMFEDITAKHEHEQASLANLAALERLNRLKSEFMSMVSHEFRTALTGIQGYSEVMTTEEVSTDEVKEFAGDINADALRLNRMITEMLDLDRIESGRMQMHMDAVDLNRLVTDAVDRARMSTDKHQIVADLDPCIGAVQGDCDRLTQVVSNLLSNAIKYSAERSEIVVGTRLQEGNVEVSVRDHGQGIPPEFITRIFGRYERYDDGTRSGIVGTGLGLAIAQQIVQLHKGRIWVESAVGEGSTFRFTIPATSDAGVKVA
jgi:PAS domain S-box-containing protein